MENIETVELPSDNLIYRDVTISVSMSKNMCLEVPENFTKEQIIDLAKKEILTPDKIMNTSEQLFKQMRVNIGGIDFKGWIVDDLEYIVE